MPQNMMKHGIKVSSMLSFLGLLLWILYYFNAVPLYAELIIFDNKIFSVSVLMGVWILLMMACVLLRGKVVYARKNAILLTLILYMLVTTMIQYIANPTLINVIGMSSFGSIVLNIALLGILLAQMMVPGVITDRLLSKLLVFLSVPVVCFGMLQIINGYSKITLVIFHQYVKNVPYDFYGFNRPYSFFTQSITFGFYAALLVAILWLSVRTVRSIPIKAALFGTLIVMASVNILSFTRTAIVAMCFVLFYLWLDKKLKCRRVGMIFAPFMFFLIMVILFFYGVDVANVLKSILGVFAHSASTSIREDELLYYLKMYGSAKWWQMLIGIGPIINSIPEKTGMFIDNSYLYLLLQYGVIGIALWLLAVITIWRDMYLVTQRNPTVLRGAIVAFWSTWFAVSLFATDLGGYILISILFYMLNTKSETKNVEGDSKAVVRAVWL